MDDGAAPLSPTIKLAKPALIMQNVSCSEIINPFLVSFYLGIKGWPFYLGCKCTKIWNRKSIRCPHIVQSHFFISRILFPLFYTEDAAIVTLWFKSSLCFSTFCDFWQLFFSPSAPRTHCTFSQILSDQVIHARLHGVWTRPEGIQSQWTLTETSVKLQLNGKNRGLPSIAKAAAPVMWIYVQRVCGLNLQTTNKGGRSAEY